MNFKEVLIRLIAYTTPYVYDNNISLLELVRKLYKIVNELCIALQELNTDYEQFKADVNSEIESFESDINADMQDLKNYVDEYFESLDIEQSIRDVLEEMTEDGTLEELLNQTVLANINSHLSTLDTEISGLTTRVGTLETDNTTNKTNITNLTGRVGTLESDNTTNKTNITNLTDRVGTLESDNTTNKGNITNLTGRVGTLESDNTTNKANIQGLEDYLNINTFESVPMGTLTRGTIQTQNINVAKNSDGSLAKIYGNMTITVNSNLGTTFEMQTSLRPDQDIQINMLGIRQFRDSFTELYTINPIIHTDGRVTIENMNTNVNMQNQKIFLFPCLLFIKSFGDVGD